MRIVGGIRVKGEKGEKKGAEGGAAKRKGKAAAPTQPAAKGRKNPSVPFCLNSVRVHSSPCREKDILPQLIYSAYSSVLV